MCDVYVILGGRQSRRPSAAVCGPVPEDQAHPVCVSVRCQCYFERKTELLTERVGVWSCYIRHGKPGLHKCAICVLSHTDSPVCVSHGVLCSSKRRFSFFQEMCRARAPHRRRPPPPTPSGARDGSGRSATLSPGVAGLSERGAPASVGRGPLLCAERRRAVVGVGRHSRSGLRKSAMSVLFWAEDRAADGARRCVVLLHKTRHTRSA